MYVEPLIDMEEAILNNVNSTIELIYQYIKETIMKNGGFINATSENKTPIYFCTLFSDAYYRVIGLRVEDGDIEFCASKDKIREMTDDELNELVWFDLRSVSTCYLQNIYNIFKTIKQYI